MFLGSSAVHIAHYSSQSKLEAQYAAKRDAHQGEVADLKQQLDMRSTEIRNLNSTIDGLKGVNEELKVRDMFQGTTLRCFKSDNVCSACICCNIRGH